ncbi:unnamed protein product [Gongylonema pulchrum]|uniref:Glycosyltransferase family 92 protein n=1 Tax=Gongylonema pulchrum TaxID=637853 RepID=A0A183F0M9_9BILA|nr:unnamed protein product [Gongylonema pulchrum]
MCISVLTQVPFRQPVREQYDVVACFSPLFLNEHWQLLLTSLEVRRAHGLSLQVFYIYSIRSPLMDILRAYEKHGFVALEKWARIDLGDSGGLDYDPNYELVWRNQEGAHTDCFLKYKVTLYLRGTYLSSKRRR